MAPQSWENADPAKLHAVVTSIAALGGAVLFGVARDGSAVSVRVYHPTEGFTKYIAGYTDLNHFLDRLTADIEFWPAVDGRDNHA